MKVAIVHDFLVQNGGAEKVVEVLHGMYPEAPIYTSMYDSAAMPASYKSWDIRTSFLQKVPRKKHSHKIPLLLYPLAFESFDLSRYDLVISSSSSFAKGVITQPHTTHICYCHAPMRFAWSTRTYLENERIVSKLRTLLVPGLHYLRNWDAIAALRVDRFVANSGVVAKRIHKFYRVPSTVIHPPVDTSRFSVSDTIEDYYTIVSRAIPYKRLDLAVDAFSKLGIPLKIAGSGRQMAELKSRAASNVTFLGRVSDADLPGLLSRAKGYVMPGEEDFGIAPVEANASGRPVIAYAAGGALDSQIDGKTGVLFPVQTVESLIDAVQRAEQTTFDPHYIRNHALGFDTQVFCSKLQALVDETMRRGTAASV
jgi:glycosyltransferase involved in cell wall biosynthesis